MLRSLYIRNTVRYCNYRPILDTCRTRFALLPCMPSVTTPGERLDFNTSTKRRKLCTDGVTSPPLQMKMMDGLESTAIPRENSEIELTAVESTLRRLLLDVASDIDRSDATSSHETPVNVPEQLAEEKLVLRFTGGWVRDKLLGVESHDIDVAINKMTGLQFGLRMKDYLDQPGNSEKYGLEGVAKSEAQSNKAAASSKNKMVGGLHKIEANPEKSKHLETVTTRILGLDIDLVNLRKETYSEESRNPQMEFGTPEEDALRRDATVNAMFFNLNTCKIEDLTGKGRNDMQAKIIRTPLEPYQTFKDDPLRVLRLIRFASRLNYVIDPPAEEFMSNQDIKDALKLKISRERVGVELEKMLRGPDPYMAVSLIDRLGLYNVVFSDPGQVAASAFDPDVQSWRELLENAKSIMATERPARGAFPSKERLRHSIQLLIKFPDILLSDPEDKYIAWLLACMVPYRDAPVLSAEPGRKVPPPVAANVAREGIKATNKVCEVITLSVRHREEISALVRSQGERRRRPHQVFTGDDPFARDILGMAIRRWGPSWRAQTVYALFADIADNGASLDAILRDYDAYLTRLQELDILEAYSLKPLLDGKALAKAMSTRPGPWMKEALDVVMAWQLRNPGNVSSEEVLEEVKNAGSHGELTTVLIAHLLRLTIRPMFLKNQHPAVTAAGRKATSATMPKALELDKSEEEIKPWKSRESNVIEILQWVVQNADQRSIEDNWHLLIPPVLSITDDYSPDYKAIGCALLTHILKSTPPSLLARTGLGQVFEEALLPCLGYFPSLTPEGQSINLLRAAYPALIALSRSSYPEQAPPGSRSAADDVRARRTAFLDLIIRKGILAGYAHCSENVKITKVLLENFCLINNELGIDSVKHFKHVLPMLSEILSQPFGSMYPPLILSALKTLQNVILNGWPRIPSNRAEILRGLSLCWLQSQAMPESEMVQVRLEMKTALSMLKAAVFDDHNLEQEMRALVEADARLEGLYMSP